MGQGKSKAENQSAGVTVFAYNAGLFSAPPRFFLQPCIIYLLKSEITVDQ